MTEQVYFEQPLSERIRTFLRLELLFEQIQHHLKGTTDWDARATLATLNDIWSAFGRADLKTEILKELERQTATLARMESNPGVDRKRLGEILDRLDLLTDRLFSQAGQPMAIFKKHDLLSALRQRSTIPGGTCTFDLPGFHLWMQQPTEQRTEQMRGWLGHVNTIELAIAMVLQLTRGSSTPTREVAGDGTFQRNLDPTMPCQLIRVAIPADAPYFAEISGGKHRFSVRFMEQPDFAERAFQTSDDVPFELTTCVL